MEQIKLVLDRKKATEITRELLKRFDQSPIEDYLSIIEGVTITLLAIAMNGKEQTNSINEDEIEKFILKEMKTMSEIELFNIHFDKYINL